MLKLEEQCFAVSVHIAFGAVNMFRRFVAIIAVALSQEILCEAACDGPGMINKQCNAPTCGCREGYLE